MQIELAWGDNERLEIARDKHPLICQAFKEVIHPESRKATRDLAIAALVGFGMMVTGAIILTLLHTVLGGVTLLIFLLLFWLTLVTIRRNSNNIDILLSLYNGQTHTYKLTEEGVVQEVAGSTLLVPWTSIWQLCINDQWVMLLVRDYTFFLIPTRAFQDDDQREAWVATIEQRAGVVRIDERL